MGGVDVSGGTLDDLKAVLRVLAAKNHTERLCVAESASKHEVRAAFLKLVQKFHPHRFSHRGVEHEKVANEIFLVIKESHDELIAGLAGAAARVKRRTSPPAAGVRHSSVRFKKVSPPATKDAAPVRPLVTPKSQPVKTVTLSRAEAARARKQQPRIARGRDAVRISAIEDNEPTPIDHSGLVAKLESEEEANLTQYRAASKLLREGRAAEARTAFRILAVANPAEKRYRTYMHFSWGREHELAGRVESAMTEYQRALNVNPRFTPALEALETLQALDERQGVFGRLFRRQK